MVDVQPVLIPVIWTVFSVLCLYDFWTSYRNTNLHMHIEQPKNILYNVILLAHLTRGSSSNGKCHQNRVARNVSTKISSSEISHSRNFSPVEKGKEQGIKITETWARICTLTKQIELRCILNIELLLDWLFIKGKALGASVEAVPRISKGKL